MCMKEACTAQTTILFSSENGITAWGVFMLACSQDTGNYTHSARKKKFVPSIYI